MKYLLSLIAVAGCVLAQPVITAVQDAGGYTNNIAQGSVFVVKGTGLSAAGVVLATAPSYPTTLNNVQIAFMPTAAKAPVMALMAYTYNQGGVNQLAAVLPSTAAPGTYNVEVINNGVASANFATTVVARKPGIVTASSDGQGQAQATLNDGTTLIRNSNVGAIGAFATRAAHPGDYVILWGTGLGPDTASDTGGSSGNLRDAATIRVTVNGAAITPEYAGRSQGYPGLDQIVFILPANVTLSCAVAIQVTEANGVQSNAVTIATAASNTDACTPATGGGGGGSGFGLSQADIDRIVASGAFKFGTISLLRSSTTTAPVLGQGGGTTRSESATAVFQSVIGADLRNLLQGTSSLANFTPPADGVCNVLVITTAGQSYTSTPNLTYANLDAGGSLTMQGPGGSRVLTKSTAGTLTIYGVTITGGFQAGSYTVSGPGGAGPNAVGSFNVTGTLAPELLWTNMAAVATVTRSNGMPITWSGGDPTQLIAIFGYSVDTSSHGAAFWCYANQSRGSFMIPVSVLNQLPASTTTGSGQFQFTIPGSVQLTSTSAPVITTASGLDFLALQTVTTVGQSVAFQ